MEKECLFKQTKVQQNETYFLLLGFGFCSIISFFNTKTKKWLPLDQVTGFKFGNASRELEAAERRTRG
jgi:hypothetical protein